MLSGSMRTGKSAAAFWQHTYRQFAMLRLAFAVLPVTCRIQQFTSAVQAILQLYEGRGRIGIGESDDSAA
jgi:hypothetical protein